jgi:hypothetical protein
MRTKGHEINKCYTISTESQKQHLVHHVHLRLARLSFVNRTLPWRNHIKILIFRGFNFHRYLCQNCASSFTKSRYIDLTVNISFLFRFQTNLFGLFDSWTTIKCWHKCNQPIHLLPESVRLNVMFSGLWDKTSAIRLCFFCAILYKIGY